MNGQDRRAIKYLVDKAARNRVDNGYMDCDPESLTIRAMDADKMGFPEVAQALRKFRDEVVNKLLADGWDLNRIEMATLNWGRKNNATLRLK